MLELPILKQETYGLRANGRPFRSWELLLGPCVRTVQALVYRHRDQLFVRPIHGEFLFRLLPVRSETVSPASGKRFVFNLRVGSIPIPPPQF